MYNQTDPFYKNLLYSLTRFCTRQYFKLLFRMELKGRENLPKQGGFLLASNHISLADPPVLGSALPGFIYFFAKEELFRFPLFGWYLHQLHAFPVKRFEHDIAAFKKSLQLLLNQEAVLLFPEGRRSKTGALGPAKSGIGMLAFKTGAPVVPVYIHNSNRMKQFKKITVFLGSPIRPSEAQIQNKAYQEFSDEVMKAIADLQAKML